jgi:phage shock protein PspC (stress-responsive transcriptional regulator)
MSFFDLARLLLSTRQRFRQEFQMQAQDATTDQGYTPLPLRAHTILGVCEAIGEDFRFNPIFLRIPLAAMVVVNPLWAFGAYFALGGVVLLSRILFPRPTRIIGTEASRPAPANEQSELARAA